MGEQPCIQHTGFSLANLRGKCYVTIGSYQREEPMSFNGSHQPMAAHNVITNDNTADVTQESISDISDSRGVFEENCSPESRRKLYSFAFVNGCYR